MEFELMKSVGEQLRRQLTFPVKVANYRVDNSYEAGMAQQQWR